jgi:hypothetical protein
MSCEETQTAFKVGAVFLEDISLSILESEGPNSRALTVVLTPSVTLKVALSCEVMREVLNAALLKSERLDDFVNISDCPARTLA